MISGTWCRLLDFCSFLSGSLWRPPPLSFCWGRSSNTLRRLADRLLVGFPLSYCTVWRKSIRRHHCVLPLCVRGLIETWLLWRPTHSMPGSCTSLCIRHLNVLSLVSSLLCWRSNRPMRDLIGSRKLLYRRSGRRDSSGGTLGKRWRSTWCFSLLYPGGRCRGLCGFSFNEPRK